MKKILVYTIPAGTNVGRQRTWRDGGGGNQVVTSQDVLVDVLLDERRLWQTVRKAATNKGRVATAGPLVVKVRQ